MSTLDVEKKKKKKKRKKKVVIRSCWASFSRPGCKLKTKNVSSYLSGARETSTSYSYAWTAVLHWEHILRLMEDPPSLGYKNTSTKAFLREEMEV